MIVSHDEQFKLGKALDGCCGKPVGCGNASKGCRYLRHPWKLAVVFNDPDAPCPKKGFVDGKQAACSLLNGHDGCCELE